jgi:hypothetical protein
MSRWVRRIKVTTESRVRVHTAEIPVTIVGLSARDALVVSPQPLGVPGDIIDIYLPAVGRREIELTAGVGATEEISKDFAVVVEFMIAEPKLRVALNDHLRLILAGEGGGTRRHARVLYDVPVRYGASAERAGRLEEISFGGLALYVNEALSPGANLRVVVPDHKTNANLSFEGKVVDQRAAKEGGFLTGVELAPLSATMRGALARLLADLLCR